MKVILSRKGFDSEYGGCASPILPDGTMVSMPIPSPDDECLFEELSFPGGGNYFETWNSLKAGGEKLRTCHLDPDIRRGIRKEISGWVPTFGQMESAQGHLVNQGIETGDIFLFFGWFKEMEYQNGKLIYKRGAKDIQAIYGYFQIGGMYTGEEVKRFSWHPHSKYTGTNNTIYTATDSLVINGQDFGVPGVGTLKYSDSLVLSAPGMSRSRWKLIDVFSDKSISLSYHDKNKCIKNGYFQSAAKGQEFVFAENDFVTEWAKKLIISSGE